MLYFLCWSLKRRFRRHQFNFNMLEGTHFPFNSFFGWFKRVKFEVDSFPHESGVPIWAHGIGQFIPEYTRTLFSFNKYMFLKRRTFAVGRGLLFIEIVFTGYVGITSWLGVLRSSLDGGLLFVHFFGKNIRTNARIEVEDWVSHCGDKPFEVFLNLNYFTVKTSWIHCVWTWVVEIFLSVQLAEFRVPGSFLQQQNLGEHFWKKIVGTRVLIYQFIWIENILHFL